MCACWCWRAWCAVLDSSYYVLKEASVCISKESICDRCGPRSRKEFCSMSKASVLLIALFVLVAAAVVRAGQPPPFPFDGAAGNTASACADVLVRNPSATNGEYDLAIGEPGNYELVHTACDFTTDSRVWSRVTISDASTGVYEDAYANGLENGTTVVIACGYLPTDGIFRLDMGTTQDYFRPNPSLSATSCSMLQSASNHLWRPTGESFWVNPLNTGHLGGSAYLYPTAHDGRSYVGFWGTTNDTGLFGGCCVNSYSNSAHSWNKAFTLWVSELQIPTLDVDATTLQSSDTISLACDEQVPTSSPTGEYSVVVQNVLRKVHCEFDGSRTWARVAVASPAVYYGPTVYAAGRNVPEYSSDFVVPCAALPTNGIIRINMGAVTDFFKPDVGQDMCSMLQTHDKHLWKRTDNGVWMNPTAPSQHLGGSGSNVPAAIDGRQYVSFWGSDNNTLFGGCCHTSYTPSPSWGRAFEMYVSEYIPGTDD